MDLNAKGAMTFTVILWTVLVLQPVLSLERLKNSSNIFEVNDIPSVLSRHPRNVRNKTFIEPKMIKFELSDAREPDELVKELIRKHRGREMQLLNNKTQIISKEKIKDVRSTTNLKTTIAPMNIRKKIVVTRNSTGSDRARIKRLVPIITPRMIPFDESDAREPDAATKELIAKARSRELKQLSKLSSSSDSSKAQSGKTKVKANHKRSRRSAQQTPPRMIKFEIEDAKNPGEPLKTLLKKSNQEDVRDSKPLSKDENLKEGKNDTLTTDEDQDKHESKRFYFYEEAPAKSTSKVRSINSLPHEVQKAISHILKENRGAKAYVKYIPAQDLHKYQETKGPVGYGGGAPAYIHYVKPLTPSPVVPLPLVHVPVPVQQEFHQVHVQPVIEKIRYVYAASPGAELHGVYGSHGPTVNAVTVPSIAVAPVHEEPTGHANIPEPIVVAEQQHPVVEVQQEVEEGAHGGEDNVAPEVQHHQYSSAGHIFQPSEPPPEEHSFKPSPMDTKSGGGNQISIGEGQQEGAGKEYLHQYPSQPYKLFPKEQGSSGLGKGLYHYQNLEAGSGSAVNNIHHGYNNHMGAEYTLEKQILNYKNLQEFKELSSLIGKSPEDQIHGLTYLLAKEMQNNLKLQRQQKQSMFYGGGGGGGDGGSIGSHGNGNIPTLFHSMHGGQGYGQLSSQSKDYVPISEGEGSKSTNSITTYRGDGSGSGGFLKHSIGAAFGAKMPPATSYQSQGLSPNYEGIDKGFPFHQKSFSAAKPGLDTESGHGYASKYAFGYRIRDFSTGNDFGHKQNRDINGVTHGQYHILLPDGRIQNVIYHADDTGFHADVSFETGH